MESQVDGGEEIEIDELLADVEQEEEEEDEEEEEEEESWDGGNLEENLEKLLEKYANLANDGGGLKSGEDEDENDTTDYYSMKLGARPPPFIIIENTEVRDPYKPKENDVVEKRSIGTITTTNTAINEEPPIVINKRNSATTAAAATTTTSFETSLIETRKELDLNQSAISTTSSRLSKADLNKIYTELNDIHQRLFRKEKLLRQRELKLKQNEEYLSLVNNEFGSKLKFEEIKSKYDQQLSTIREDIRAKVKENKRLYHAFKSIRDSNDSLRLKLSETQEKMTQMERQNSSLNGRLFNLLKKIEKNENRSNLEEHQKPQPTTNSEHISQTKSTKKQVQLKVSQISTLDSLANSLEWINETSLRRLDFNLPLAESTTSTTTTTTTTTTSKLLEKIQRILPTVSQYIQAFNSTSTSTSPASSLSSSIAESTSSYYKRYALIFLEFAYLSLLHADAAYHNQKVNLSATFRHIGEEVYKCLLSYRTVSKSTNYFRPVKEDDKRELAADVDQIINGANTTLASVSCDNKHARILSCLIVLKTLNQVDVLVNVFELLRDDLVDEESKQTFLDLHGTWTVLKFCRLNNHILLDLAVDIYLQLSMVEGIGGNKQQSERFIETCSNEYWFSQLALIFRNSNVTSSRSVSGTLSTSSSNAFLDLKVVEKLSILLQKLSKIRSNRKYFEMFSLNKICSNLLQRFHTESNFLSMNLKSIISNLNGEQIK